VTLNDLNTAVVGPKGSHLFRIRNSRFGPRPVCLAIQNVGNPARLSRQRTCGFLPSEPQTRMRNIRAAYCLEQVKAPTQLYHQQMKRELPVTRCTECGGAGYNIRVANGRCCRNISERRCNGSNGIAVETAWSECPQCQATGYYRNKECPNCKGVGYLFIFFRDKTTV